MARGTLDGWLLESRCLLATGGPYLLPSPTVDCLGKVLYNGVTGTYQKTITITNNSPTQTIYAFLEGQVSRQAVSPYEGTGAFDPFDSSNQEYRGYIGYTDGTADYAGLPPLSAITITVPLAFWDSGRIIFSTDGADQFSTYGGSGGGSPPGAPFYYQDTNTQATFYGSIDPDNLNQLDFTPAYDSFDSQDGYKPTTANWKSPVASGALPTNRTFILTGPGLPASGFQVTVDPSHPGYIQLPGNGIVQNTPVQGYTFTTLPNQTISKTDRYIQPDFTLTTQGSPSTNNGVVMWYHALTPQAPNNDAPFQLTEVTFRGEFYDPQINTTTGFQYLLGDAINGADTDSADYDISFVDTINMPVAMEASNVSIPNSNVTAPFGWVGSNQSLEDFQAALAAFTGSNPAGRNNNYLGTYFNGQGYPSYLAVDNGNIKLPAGQNLFLASPAVPGGAADIKYFRSFSDKSVINEPLYALTSGGTGPVSLSIGGDPAHASTGHFLGLNTAAMANAFALNELIAPNVADHVSYTVTYNVGKDTLTAGKVVGMYYDNNGNIIGVELDQDVPASASTLVYSFTLSQKDYAAGGIAGLWYSWAQYYANNVQSTAMNNATGRVTDNILTLSSAATGLVPGMVVTGNGVPAGCVVLAVSGDGKTITLSEVISGSPTSFNFATPAFGSIVGYDPKLTPLVDLSFTQAEQPYALAFAQTVFTVLNAWSVSVPAGTANPWDPLLVNIIGGNLGLDYLPLANTSVVNLLTDLSKSALRGVPDFTNPLYSDPSQWYPDPALSAGGLDYNAYNLDPFVWFIHEKLGLSAYAFALDDDVGNVNGGGANHIDISVGGLNGLSNKDPYTPTSPWGVITTTAASAPALSSQLGGLSNPQAVYQIAQFDYNHNTVGTLVNGPGVQMGSAVQFTQISPNVAQSQVVLSMPLANASNGSTYAFFGPLVFTGTVLGTGQAGNTIILNSPDAYNTLLKIGPLQNIQVTGEGIDSAKTLSILSMTKAADGTITITLSGSLDSTRISQPGSFYAYTFGSPNVGVVRDGGFEWATVLGLAGNFNHGTQLTQNTVDWTFTDSPPNTGWLAGIAYGSNSDYTSSNPAPPQGLQVGFVQGTSSMSQKVTTGTGPYLLTFYAAQSSNNQSPQTLNVFVDDALVGSITPSGTSYETVELGFNQGAGAHTITFQGAQPIGSSILLDAVATNPGSPSGNPPQPTPPASPPSRVTTNPNAGVSERAPAGVPLVSGFGRGRDAFVSTLFRDFGRDPSLRELRYWSRLMAAGANPQSVALGIWRGSRHRMGRIPGLAAPMTFRRSFSDALLAALKANRNRPIVLDAPVVLDFKKARGS
ncbi:hypothetical protein ACYOEI_06755 [Singulisphaera rosea]